MKKRFVTLGLLIFLILSLQTQASYYEADYFDDNVYGDYLISSSKEKISMDLEKASLINTLKVLSKQTGLSFVSSQSVKSRKLTLYLDNVPLKEALDSIFKANNLAYDFQPESNIFIIKELGKPTTEVETRVYYLQYARVSSSTLSSQAASVIGSSGGGGESGGIKAAIKDVMSSFGKIVEDPRTNSLVVTDIPPQFPAIESVIKSLDIPVPKLMIEVEMLEVAKTLVDQVGVQFENGINVGFSGGSRETSWPLFWNAPSERAFGSASFAKSTITLGEVDLSSLNILLQLLHEDVSTKVLARPKIFTLSGETAEIKITTDEAISVKKTEDANTSDIEFEVERAETGSSLRVTPHVNVSTGEITMLVEPRIARAEATEFEFEDFTVKDIQQRQTKSLVVVKEGHTLVIGGLLARQETKIKTKVPFLGDIPLVGAAFRHSDTHVEERELLIFLTPHIIRDSGDYASVASSMEPREQSRQGRQSAIDNSLARFE